MKNMNIIISLALLVGVALLILACDDDSPPMGPTGGGNVTVPVAPSGLQASQQSQSSVLLNWQDNSSHEDGFRIERSLSPASGFSQVGSVGKDASSYTAPGLNSATTYYFRVCAFNSAGNSSYSGTTQAKTLDAPTNPPTPPSNLQAGQPTRTSVLLEWQDKSNNEDGFKVERSSIANGGFAIVATFNAGTDSSTISNLTPGSTYYFRVNAFNSAGTSSYTNIVRVATLDTPGTPPAAPSNLQASQPSHSSLHLNWQTNSDNETGFKVEMSLFPSGGFAEIASAGAGVSTTTISNLNPSTTYYFRVYAYNAAGNSSYSNTVNATTLSDPPPASPPVLTGPTSAVTDGQHFLLEWTYDWSSCTFCPGTSGYQLEESSTSSSSGFNIIWSSFNTMDRESPKSFAITPRSAGTYWYRVRANDYGWSDYSNVVKVTVEAPVSSTRFVNNTSYIIVSLKINGQEQFPVSPMGILPGHYYELEFSPGMYDVTASNGFWDAGGSRFTMYMWAGQFNQQPGMTGEVTFNDPTIEQLLTRWTNSGYWQGSYWAGTNLYFAGFRFFSNSKWDFYDNGTKTASGNYSVVSRNPGAFTVDFTIGSYRGTLYETFGYFAMPNGPQPTPWIEYYHEGAAGSPEGSPIDVPLNVSISPAVER
jgi:hypothetical protein